MKPVIIIAIAFVLLIPIDAFSISISEIERKLSQAQSQEDVENVILEVVKSREYQEACQTLLDKLSSMSPPKTQADAEKALPTLQDYENLKCAYTKNIWGDPPEQFSKTQCDELIVKFEEYNERYWNIDKERQRIFHAEGLDASHEYLETSEWWYLKDLKRETKGEYHKFCLPRPQECEDLSQESAVLNEKWIELDKKFKDTLEQKVVSIDLQEIKDRIELRCGYENNITQYYETQEKYFGKSIPTVVSSSDIVCGKGTTENAFGQCVPEHETMVTEMQQKSSKGGGCLIATAIYGTELAPEVQQLRELRDNKLLNTESGTSFINSFNTFYYSFSPVIADYERENPVFKEMVKIVITPMISSLSILN